MSGKPKKRITSTNMMDWVGVHVSEINTIEDDGSEVEITWYPYAEFEPRKKIGKGRNAAMAFRNAVLHAMFEWNQIKHHMKGVPHE